MLVSRFRYVTTQVRAGMEIALPRVMTTTTKYTSKPASAPVFFVNPNTGDVITLDLRTATFTKKGA